MMIYAYVILEGKNMNNEMNITVVHTWTFLALAMLQSTGKIKIKLMLIPQIDEKWAIYLQF